MKNRWITIPAAMILCLTTLVTVEAQNRNGNRPYRYGPDEPGEWHPREARWAREGDRPIRRQMAIPDLTQEQSDALKPIRLEHFKAMTPLRSQMGELRARKRTLMSEEEVDLKAVHSVIDEQAEVMKEMQKLQAEHRLAVRSVLTEEQIMQLERRRQHSTAMRRGRCYR